MPVNPENVWVLEFSISRLRTIVSGLHFCLSFRAGFHLQASTCAIRIWVVGWMGFSFFFFFSFRVGNRFWLSFVAVCFLSFSARSILAART